MATQIYGPAVVSPQMLAQSLKSQQFIPATIGPDVFAQQLKLQQDSANAQRLLQDAATPLQGQMISGHYVAPSWTQAAAQALKGYLGQKYASELPEQYANVQAAQQQNLARQFGVALGGQRAQDPTSGQGASAMPVQPQAPAPTMPLLPGKSAEQSMLLYQQMGPQAYLKLALEQSGPTDLQKNALAMGLQPGTPEYQNYIRAATARPVNVSPGAIVFDPVTRQTIMSAPQNGIQMVQGPNGQFVAQPVQGYAKTNADIAGAQARAQAEGNAAFDLVNVPDGKGGTVQMPRDQAAALLRPQTVPTQGGAPTGQPGSGGLGTTPNPKMQEAWSALPQVLANAEQMLKTIDEIDKAPGLSRSVGMMSLLPTRPGSESADANAKIDQLKGQVFLQAYQALKGSGAITEVEGAKAENALARLQVNQSEAGFRSALKDIRDVVTSARNRAYQQAGITPPDASGIFSPKNGQDYQSLPSGAMFRAPDGTIRQKP